MPPKQDGSPSRVAAAFLRDWLPELQRDSDESVRELSQGGAWLTAIASGFLALVFANERLEAALGPSRTLWVTLPLVGVVFAGVAQRVFHQLGAIQQRNVVQEVRARLTTMLLEVEEPWLPQEIATTEMAVTELASFFGLDYGFLLSPTEAPLASAREAYTTQYDLWSKKELARRELFAKLAIAFQGKPSSEVSNFFNEDQEAAIEAIRTKGRRVVRLLRAGSLAYNLAGGLLIFAMCAAIYFLS